MTTSPACHRISLPAFLFLLTVLTALSLSSGQAGEWVRVSSKDKMLSALFPVDLRENMKTETDRTLAGKVTSYFGEHYGDGFMLAGSGADIPAIANVAGNSAIFNESKKTFLKQAQGTETSSKETTVQGAPAVELIYKGDAYQGKGDPYTGRALLIMVKKRMYVLNHVITKENEETKAAGEKMFNSIEIAK